MTEGSETLSSSDLAHLVGGEHHGPERRIVRLASVTQPRPDAVAVWPEPDASSVGALAEAGIVALVVRGAHADDDALRSALESAGVALVRVDDTRLALARASRRLDRRPAAAAPGVDGSAVVDASAVLGEGVRIGPGAHVAAGASLGDRAVLGARCTIGIGASLGAGSVAFDGVMLYDGVRIGARARLHAGVVIGADGFGYAFGPRGAEKIHHLGSVVIGDDVEIGANTAIDRGTIDDTRLGDRVKIDNLCQIGHNVVIGDDVVIAGLSGVAGSCRIGDRVIIGGGCMIADHVEIGDDARLAGGSGVTKHVPTGETWGGLPAQPFRGWVRERYLVGRLERIWQRVRAAHGTP